MKLDNSLAINFEKEYGLNLQEAYKEFDLSNYEANLVLAKFMEKYKRFPVFAVTGPAGSGKSTLAKAIAKFYQAEIFRELPEINPFLPLIGKTKGKVRDSLWYPNQTFFCSTDSAVITDGFMNAFKKPIVFDFAITQTKAFRDLRLVGFEKKNFNKMFENIVNGGGKKGFGGLPKPDLVIEIRSDDKSIIKRREARGKRVDSIYEDEVGKMNELYKSGFLNNHYENVIIFDNSNEVTEEELIKKVNDFLAKLSI